MSLMRWASILMIALLFSGQLFAQVPPRHVTLGKKGFVAGSLGNTCYAMDTVTDGLPCNPASLGKERKGKFDSHFYFGNETSYLDEVGTLLEGKGDKQTVEKLFSHRNEQSVASTIELSYSREKWGLSVAPMTITYYSKTRNQALPQMTLFAMQEQSVAVQFGSYMGHDVFLGTQFRGVERKFISSDFSFTEAISEGGSLMFEPGRQSAFYIEPGFIFEKETSDWRPQFSAMVTNLGFVSEKFADFPTNAELRLGASVKAPITIGQWETGVSLITDSATKNLDQQVRLGTIYSLGITDWLASTGKDYSNVGLMLHYHAMTGALVVKDNQEVSLQWGFVL